MVDLSYLYGKGKKIANEFFVTVAFFMVICYYEVNYFYPGGGRMELGQRLHQARLEAGLSQRQLCEGIVTRNMLSQIENGSARPSMTTLQQFAARLGKSVGYFIEAEAVTSPNQAAMERARKAYSDGQYKQVLAALEEYRSPDPVFDWECAYLDALSRIALAEQVLSEGKTAYALTLLEQAAESGSKTPYYTSALERQRLLLCYQARPEDAQALARLLPENLQETLLRAESLLAKEPEKSLALLDGAPSEYWRWHYLKGQAYLLLKNYSAAAEHYEKAQSHMEEKVWAQLEECYRELGDFQQAYRYACLQKR